MAFINRLVVLSNRPLVQNQVKSEWESGLNISKRRTSGLAGFLNYNNNKGEIPERSTLNPYEISPCLCTETSHLKPKILTASFPLPGFASIQDVSKYRSELFTLEQKRQQDNVGRIEKIEVRYLGVPQDETFVLNKDISTPYDIAKRKTRSRTL